MPAADSKLLIPRERGSIDVSFEPTPRKARRSWISTHRYAAGGVAAAIVVICVVVAVMILGSRSGRVTNSNSAKTGTEQIICASPGNDTVPGSRGEMELRALVLTSDDPDSQNAAKLIFDAYNMPYDLIAVPRNGIRALPILETAGGRALYSMVLFTHADMRYQYENGTYASALTAGQLAQLERYEVSRRVRRVVFGDVPNTMQGTAFVSGSAVGTDASQNVTFSPEFAIPAGVFATAIVASESVYHVPAVIANATSSTVAVCFLEPLTPALPNRTILGVTTSFPSGLQQMTFYMPLESWSLLSHVLGHIWFHWATQGLYQGTRKVVFTPQVDDLFLETQVEAPPSGKGYRYRTSVDDMQNLFLWLKDLNGRLPKGSDVRFEVGFNGNGAMPLAYSPGFDVEARESNDFVKPLGTGISRWPRNYSTRWDDATLKNDGLYRFFASDPANQNPLYWVSHTFTHLNFNDATLSDVLTEVSTNVEFASPAHLGLSGKAWFSPLSLITPQISGMSNGDTFLALQESGVKAVVGDNSRPLLLPKRKHLPFRTSKLANGYEGFLVVPRQPAEVYYNCTMPSENVLSYNTVHPQLGGAVTWPQILSSEAHRVAIMMLGLRRDAHMLHQGNLRNADLPSVTVGSGTAKMGLAQQWTEAVFGLYTSIVSWPVVTLKMDDLAKTFVDRETRDLLCQPRTTLSYTSDGSLSSFTVVAQSYPCRVPVTIPADVTIKDSPGPWWFIEAVGAGPGSVTTVWVNVTECNPVTLKLQTAMRQR